VSATGGGRSRGTSALIIGLKGFAWLLCAFVLLAIGTSRADQFDGRDIHFRQGYAVGSVLLSLTVAFGLWFAVQHGIRKRRGFPPWIGVIAIGVSCLLLLVDVGKRGVAEAACVPVDKAYGAPPAGWTYAKADADQRAELSELTDIASDPEVDVSIATRRESGVVMLAVPDGVESFVAGAESGARKQGATVSRTSSGATVLDYPDDAARIVVGVRGCNAVLIDGLVDADVDVVAGAIFK
jgi:hypothetical protein